MHLSSVVTVVNLARLYIFFKNQVIFEKIVKLLNIHKDWKSVFLLI